MSTGYRCTVEQRNRPRRVIALDAMLYMGGVSRMAAIRDLSFEGAYIEYDSRELHADVKQLKVALLLGDEYGAQHMLFDCSILRRQHGGFAVRFSNIDVNLYGTLLELIYGGTKMQSQPLKAAVGFGY
ncbi:MAG: hypothetical protein BMS9Abin36_1057 [Gammaproteobacteria bacterium]|nr:MAG: hypothetical protein BMS9Abin36_1057 [Gammaproteobacteria bacterium]